MEGSEGSTPNTTMLGTSNNNVTLFAVIAAIIIPILLSMALSDKKKSRKRGVPVEVGGEAGFAMRNAKYTGLVEVPWEGATTVAALFEQSSKKHSQDRFLGTRKVVSRDFVTGSDGRKFEKLHLGEYHWESYGQIFERASNFASGLVKLGHDVDTRAAIFSETRAEWFIAFQVALLTVIYTVLYSLCSKLFWKMKIFFSASTSGMLPAKYYCCYHLCISRG